MSPTTDVHRNGQHHPPQGSPSEGNPPLVNAPTPEPRDRTWARTDRPLRIAILGWARLSSQAWEGSGYNLSASELARGLVMSGHQVYYLQSGLNYGLRKRQPHIMPREVWAGIHCFDLRNSPNLSPAASNFVNMDAETACPSQVELVLKWLDDVGAQLVHIHSLEGFPLDLIASIRRGSAGGSEKRYTPRPVLVTPHNYWYVCPQVDLLHHETRVCTDYDGGRRCVGCLPTPDAEKLKRSRAVRRLVEERIGPPGVESMKRVVAGVRPLLAQWKRGKLLPTKTSSPAVNPDRLIDPELAHGFEHVRGEDQKTEADGLMHHDWAIDSPGHLEPSPIDQNERFLSSTVHLKVLNEYGKRRHAGIEALNAADAILSPSNFLLKAHASMGVMESKLRWVRLGQPHFDQINRRARRTPFYDTPPWDPENAQRALRFGFYGTTRANKGLEVLIQAIPLLDRRIRQRCQFMIRAAGPDWSIRRRMSLYPEVTFSGGYDLLQLISAAGDYDVGILPHIWFENSPLVMLEHLHAGKFVVASRLGGPPDWIDPPKNGLLFAGGRPDELAWCITRLVTGEVRIPSPREIHEASVLQSYPAHVAEVDRIYQHVMDRRRAGAPAPVQDATAGA